MSKAFTREDDEAPERSFVPQLPPVPFGVKNYITADGAARLQQQLAELESVETRREGSSTRELDRAGQRMAALRRILSSSITVVEPTGVVDKVKFGAWVKVRNSAGEIEVYRIAGIYETDLGEEWISWISPLATALLNKSAGEKVKLKLPKGPEELEILEISESPLR